MRWLISRARNRRRPQASDPRQPAGPWSRLAQRRPWLALGLTLCAWGAILAVPLRAQDADVLPDEQKILAMKADEARAARQTLLAEARKLLATPVANPPTPPSLKIECSEGETARRGGETAEAYATQAGQPEADMVARLIAVRRRLQSLGVDPDPGYDLEAQLVGRLTRKVDWLFQQYGRLLDRREKFQAITAFARRTALMLQSVNDSGGEQAILARLGAWIANLLPLMIRELREHHDYSQIKAIYMVARAAQSAAGDQGKADSDSLYAQIAAAMHFDLSLTFELRSVGANGHTAIWTLKSDFPLSYDIGGGTGRGGDLVTGTGIGRYAGYVDQDPNPRTRGTMKASDFEVNAKVEDIDACAGKALFLIDRFYGENESYKAPVDDAPAVLPHGMTSWMVLYDDRLKNGLFNFPVPFHNLNPVPIEWRVAAVAGVFSGTFTIRLVHTPR